MKHRQSLLRYGVNGNGGHFLVAEGLGIISPNPFNVYAIRLTFIDAATLRRSLSSSGFATDAQTFVGVRPLPANIQ